MESHLMISRCGDSYFTTKKKKDNIYYEYLWMDRTQEIIFAVSVGIVLDNLKLKTSAADDIC